MTRRSLLCVLEHATQFDPPLWTALARRGNVMPKVWYLRRDTPRDGEIARDVRWGVTVGDGYEVTYLPTPAAALRNVLKLSPRPDAILTAGWTRPLTWHTTAAAQLRRVPVILPTDRVVTARQGRIARRLLSGFFHGRKRYLYDGFFTTGTLGAQALLAHGIDEARIARGLYPVDTAFWRRRVHETAEESAVLRARAAKNSDVVLVAVCKLSARESPLDLIEGFAHFLNHHDRKTHLLLVGDGPLREEIQTRIGELGIAEHITVAGYVPYQQLACYYGAADIFLHMPPSEPWGISVLEAMACRLPVVATASVGSGADLIVENKTGAVAQSRDAESISLALSRCIALLADRDRLRDDVAQMLRPFDVGSVAEQLEQLIARVMRSEHSTPLPARSHRVNSE